MVLKGRANSLDLVPFMIVYLQVLHVIVLKCSVSVIPLRVLFEPIFFLAISRGLKDGTLGGWQW